MLQLSKQLFLLSVDLKTRCSQTHADKHCENNRCGQVCSGWARTIACRKKFAIGLVSSASRRAYRGNRLDRAHMLLAESPEIEHTRPILRAACARARQDARANQNCHDMLVVRQMRRVRLRIFLRHTIVRAHPEQTRLHQLFSQCSSAGVCEHRVLRCTETKNILLDNC